jgi:hypothetical protein
VRRQAVYIDALQTLPDFSIIYDKYQLNRIVCRNCGHSYDTANEKMTDVNIAVELLQDGFQPRRLRK